MRARGPLTAATAIVLSAGALAGCTASDLTDAGESLGGLARDSAEEALKEATGGDVSVNFGDGAALPSDWPASVPAPEGEIAAAAVTGNGWTVAVPGPSLAVTDYVEALEDAGFKEDSSASAGSAASGHRLSDGSHQVTTAWANDPGSDSGLITVVVTPL